MYQGRNSDRLRNSEEAWERVEEFRIGGRRVGPSRSSFEEAKGRDRTENERGGG
jgi:hypothetical protein